MGPFKAKGTHPISFLMEMFPLKGPTAMAICKREQNETCNENLGDLTMQRDLLKYLDFEGYLKELATSGLKYLEAIAGVRSKGMIGPPLYFRPELNLLNLRQVSVQLLILLRNEPECAEKLLRQLSFQIFFECLGAECLEGGLQLEHIHTPLRVACHSAYSVLADAEDGAGLVILTGVLSAYTFPTKYVRSCVVRCKIKTCPGHSLRRRPGCFVQGTLCRICKCEELEMPGDRDVSEEVLATFLPLDGLTVGHRGKTKAKMIIFRDELATGMSIGCKVQVVCRRAVVSRTSSSPTLIACSRLTAVTAKLSVQLQYFPEKLQHFFGQFGDSPWAPVASMALSLGREAVPYGCLFNIRMGALLSMSSHGAHQPLHMLVTGRENVLASRLLDLAAQAAPQSVSHGCQNALSGIATRSEDGRQDLWMEAGSLLLSSSGVCVVGEWTALKRETKTDLTSAIEKGSITIKMPNKAIHFPLRASVWTHCAQLDKKSLRPMIEVFGMPFIANVTEEENQHLTLYFLNNAMKRKISKAEDEFLQSSDIKWFLNSVEATNVQMSDAASKLIRNYFVASRRARAIGGSVDECLPIGAVQSMSIMAEAHARLGLRAEVTKNDALVAIALYEQALVSLFGPAFQAPPPPLSGVDLCRGNIQQSVDNYMRATAQWLQELIKNLLGDHC